MCVRSRRLGSALLGFASASAYALHINIRPSGLAHMMHFTIGPGLAQSLNVDIPPGWLADSLHVDVRPGRLVDSLYVDVRPGGIADTMYFNVRPGGLIQLINLNVLHFGRGRSLPANDSWKHYAEHRAASAVNSGKHVTSLFKSDLRLL